MEDTRQGDPYNGPVTVFSAIFLAAVAAANPFRRTPYVGAISIDAESGDVIYQERSSERAYPASVTKLMTAYLVLDEVAAGRLRLDGPVVASVPANQTAQHFRQPSCLGIKPGVEMSVDDMLKALMVHSANDAAVFLAERVAGSMEAFVKLMNAKAESLGMKDTRYFNPNGLPPPSRTKGGAFNVSTCADQARLARSLLRDHPEITRYTSLKVLELDIPGQGLRKFVNHNNVMVKNKLKVINPDGSEAVDGLKTGYIDAGGSSVVITGTRNGKRAIVVVLGSSSAAERDAAARRLLEDALASLAL